MNIFKKFYTSVYNLLSVKFINDGLGMVYLGTHTSNADIIFEHFSHLNFYQVNGIENEYGNPLDLFIYF